MLWLLGTQRQSGGEKQEAALGKRKVTGFGVSKIQPRSSISLLINNMALGIFVHLYEPQFSQSGNNYNHTASLQCGWED